MLNNERKFPKREPVWKPLFDILYAVSLFPSGENRTPAGSSMRNLPQAPVFPSVKKSVLNLLPE
jgi:hypothetical protein